MASLTPMKRAIGDWESGKCRIPRTGAVQSGARPYDAHVSNYQTESERHIARTFESTRICLFLTMPLGISSIQMFSDQDVTRPAEIVRFLRKHEPYSLPWGVKPFPMGPNREPPDS